EGRMYRSLALVVLFALVPITADALCVPKGDTPDTTDAFAYIDAVIDSLVWTKQGFDRVRKPGQELDELLHAMKAAQADYRCVAKGLAVFAQSSNEIIGASAGVLGDTCGLLVIANERAVTELIELLNQLG